MSIARQVRPHRPYRRATDADDMYPGPDDVPQCPRCGRWPGNGITFLRAGWEFGQECDRCAQRLTPPGDHAARAARRDTMAQAAFDRAAEAAHFDTRPDCPAMDEPDYPREDDQPPAPRQPARRGWRGLWAVRDLRANDTNCITLERAPRPDGTFIAKGWLARITLAPPGGQYEFERLFMRAGSKQYAGMGELFEYELTSLDDGIYEGETVGRDGQMKRLYLLVEDQRVQTVYRGKHDAKIALARVQG